VLQRPLRIPGLVCPAVVAHRGASASHPENTLIAFDAAVRAGADMIELDVRVTADGVPVVIHDPDLAATAEGTGLVHELTLGQIRALRAVPGPAGQTGVPTLKEALTFLQGRAAVEIDIKNDPGDPGFDGGREAAATEVVRLLDELRFRSVLVTSTSPATVEWVKNRAPKVPTGVEIEAFEDPWRWLDYSARRGYAFLLPDAAALLKAGPELVDRAHALGIQIDAWTVDDPRGIAQLFAWGVDTVETNDPQTAVTVRNRVRHSQGASRVSGMQ
jgi:glycerophosphoryl diester phosphodiesterase